MSSPFPARHARVANEIVRAFTCGHCGQLVFFENSLCLRCSTPLGFLPTELDVVALTDNRVAAGDLRRCGNAAVAECNWMLEPGDTGPLCRSCRLTRTRPSDADPAGLAAFAKAEGAKRRLLCRALRTWGREVEDDRPAFDLLSSRLRPGDHRPRGTVSSRSTSPSPTTCTGEMAAPDDMGESYRTMLGHLRHEIGHYFWWMVFARDAANLARIRKRKVRRRHRRLHRGARPSRPPGPHPRLGGMPRQRLRDDTPVGGLGRDVRPLPPHPRHARDGRRLPPSPWAARPLGRPCGEPAPLRPRLHARRRIVQRTLLAGWLPLTYALNEINRSMGRDDLYPFTLAPTRDRQTRVHPRPLYRRRPIASGRRYSHRRSRPARRSSSRHWDRPGPPDRTERHPAPGCRARRQDAPRRSRHRRDRRRPAIRFRRPDRVRGDSCHGHHFD